MIILRKLNEFDIPIQDLVQIYCLYVRSIIEFNACVWFSLITEEEKKDIERVQKIACKILLNKSYTSYSESLRILKLDTLEERRIKLAIKFGEKSLDNPKMANLFKKKSDTHTNFRYREKYDVKFAYCNRTLNSPATAIQRLLNKESQKERKSNS